MKGIRTPYHSNDSLDDKQYSYGDEEHQQAVRTPVHARDDTGMTQFLCLPDIQTTKAPSTASPRLTPKRV